MSDTGGSDVLEIGNLFPELGEVTQGDGVSPKTSTVKPLHPEVVCADKPS